MQVEDQTNESEGYKGKQQCNAHGGWSSVQLEFAQIDDQCGWQVPGGWWQLRAYRQLLLSEHSKLVDMFVHLRSESGTLFCVLQQLQGF